MNRALRLVATYTMLIGVFAGCSHRVSDEQMVTLAYAILQHDKAQVEALVRANPEVVNASPRNGVTPLHTAALKGYSDIAKVLIANGARVNAKTNDGFTALHWASTREMAELLIAEGADCNAKADAGVTPLHWAASVDRAEVVEVLLSKGASINSATSAEWQSAGDVTVPKGATPLRVAEIEKNDDVEGMLRSHGGRE